MWNRSIGLGLGHVFSENLQMWHSSFFFFFFENTPKGENASALIVISPAISPSFLHKPLSQSTLYHIPSARLDWLNWEDNFQFSTILQSKWKRWQVHVVICAWSHGCLGVSVIMDHIINTLTYVFSYTSTVLPYTPTYKLNESFDCLCAEKWSGCTSCKQIIIQFRQVGLSVFLESVVCSSYPERDEIAFGAKTLTYFLKIMWIGLFLDHFCHIITKLFLYQNVMNTSSLYFSPGLSNCIFFSSLSISNCLFFSLFPFFSFCHFF